jgi:hypothetical protein
LNITNNTFISNGIVGINTTSATAASSLTVGSIVSDRGSYNHGLANATFTHNTTPTSDVNINDPKDILNLSRQGTAGKAYGARANFKLCRYENSGTNSRTRLDIHLANTSYDDQFIMCLRSDGKIGVGTSVPTEALDIIGNIKMSGSFINTNAIQTNTSLAVVNNAVYDHIKIYHNGSAGYIDAGGAVNGLILRVENSSVSYPAPSYVEAVNILPSGNVGIGITSPTNKLEVNGSIYTNNILQTGAYSILQSDTFGGKLTISNNFVGTMYYNYIYGLYGSLNIDTSQLNINANTLSQKFISSLTSTNTPQFGTYGGTGDRLILYQGGGSSYPYSLGINGGTLWYSTPSGSVQSWYIGGTKYLELSSSTLNATGVNITTDGTLSGAYLAITANTVNRNATTANYLYSTGQAYYSGGYIAITNTCAEFGSSIFCQGSILISSDERIKKDIVDIDKEDALNKLLQLRPRSYKFIDFLNNNTSNNLGFVAQEVQQILPDAVKVQSSFIPNIYDICCASSNIITTSNVNIMDKIEINDLVKFYDINGEEHEAKVDNIISSNTFSICNCKSNCVSFDGCVSSLLYGKKVQDFLTIEYNHIYNLNVSATQQLAKQVDILTSNIIDLQSQIDFLMKNKKDK